MYKFYIDDIEVEEPLNWRDIEIQWEQHREYWGYFRMVSLDEVELIGTGARMAKYAFDTEASPVVDFRIEKKSSLGIYNVFQECNLDFNSYEETLVKGRLKVKVNLVDKTILSKLKDREDNTINVGNAQSIEHKAVNGGSLIDVNYKAKRLRYDATWQWSGELNRPQSFNDYQHATNGGLLDGLLASGGVNTLTKNGSILGLELAKSNTTFSQSVESDNYWIDANSTSLLTDTNFIIKESANNRSMTCAINLDMDLLIYYIANYTGQYLIEFRFVEYYWNENLNSYDVANTLMQDYICLFNLDYANDDILPTPNASGASVHKINAQVSYSRQFSFTKLAKRTYGIETRIVNADGSYTDNQIHATARVTGDNSIYTYYDDIYDDSAHKSSLIYEAFKSTIEQITDKKDIFTSKFFGRQELGYAQDGEGSAVALTNGFLLRNAENEDGTKPTLKLEFKKLFQTMNALFGLTIFYENGKIHIEKRDWERNDIVKLKYKDIKVMPFSRKKYTEIQVGNKKIKYENVNGTNEFNSILKFSAPIKARKNVFDLLTKYNTDYLGVELARQLRFQSQNNTDTKYDKNVFVVAVERNGSSWQTKDVASNYNIISGVLHPNTAYNLDFSPKRMLLNNRDVIDAMMYLSDEDIRFESADDLASLKSRKNGEIDILVEQANYQPKAPKYHPLIYSLELGMKQAEQVFSNPNNLYEFEYLGETIQGYLYKVEIEGLGRVTADFLKKPR